jgi:hypothetical protein
MVEKLRGLVQSRIGRTLLLALVGMSLLGAAWGLKKSYDPGPVSAASPHGQPINGYESHAAFEKDCKHCHAPVRCLSANLCQDCHLEIARQRADASGLHGLLPDTGKCQTCHREHQGRDAVLTAVSFANVDHERLTGYSLDKHGTDYDGTPLTCRRCHLDGRLSAKSVDCTGCHNADDPHYMGEHAQRFGGDCLLCHDGHDRMIGFDHDQVFVLEGAHQDADCEDCHVEQTFTGMSGDCTACHPEPEVHAGQFGLDCMRCHGVAAWTPAQLTQHVFRLDHGGEGQVECEICHVGTYVEYTCYGCHDHQLADMEEVHAQEGIADFEACMDCHPTGEEGEVVRDETGGGQGG